MGSRGIWHFMSARTRRSLTLTWTALFVLSLLLQYFSFAMASPALAVHDEGLFELDGNTANDAAVAGDDWDSHPGATGNRFTFITDPLSQVTDQIFTGGGSKDDLNIPSWRHTAGSVPDKDNIEHAFAASYEAGGDTFVYFGLDRYANNGDAFVGFWFFKSAVGLNANGTFSGTHQVGDLLVLSNFTNGGAVSTIQLFEWVGSGGDTNGTLDLIASGNACTGSPAVDKACAVANTVPINPSWTFDDKFEGGTDNDIPAGSFFEGGVNLDEVFGGDAPCFSGFLAETRASQSVDATLKDFALGSFNTCEPPTIATQVNHSTVDFGGTVTDTATLSGNDGPASGSVSFFLCGPSASNPDCSTGGTQVGAAVPVTTSANGGTATSSAYTVGLTAAAVGHYCFRAEYTPDANSQYLAGSHTNLTTECFNVPPATIEITKDANPVGPVSAGESIGFDVTVHNNGTQTTLGISVNDPLPAGIDWTLGAVSGGASCQITGPVGTEVLSCTKASLAADASFTVHVSGPTDAADCGTVSNTASVATSNDGTDSDGASVVVNCPDIEVTKTPDGGSVNAGDPITWTIKVENIGAGTATGVVLSDNLPAGIDWSEAEADCSIAGAVGSEVLTCNVGTLASGASKTYTVSGTTDAADCGVVNNTASATATNESSDDLGNNADSGDVTVLCADINIVKNANPVGPVNAGDTIGFDVIVSNNGDGVATGVNVSDPLPAGVDWSAGVPTGDTTGVSCSITGPLGSEVLTCDDDSMAAGDSFTVHVSGVTDPADCGTIDNTATVTTGNDGQDSDGASVVVNCPDVHVDKTADQGTINAGDTASYAITVTNDGAGTAYDVTLTDVLPAGINWSDDSADCEIAAGILSCDFGDLAPGASASVTVSGATDPEDCGILHNVANVAASNESDEDAQDNSDSADITVNCPDVHVDKTADQGTINAGQTASYTITVTNDGAGTAYDVTLTDTLPVGINWTDDSADCEIAGGILSCDFGDLAPGASASVTVSGPTDASDCGVLHNVADVAASNESDADAQDNSDSADITVNCPDVTVVKTGNGTISAGEVASFDITVTNLGPGTAFDVTLSDQLPSGTWTLGGANAADCSINGSNLLTCDFGDLANGASRTITVSRETTAEDCGTIPNTATVAASNEAEGDTGNNESSDTITVNCPDVVITKTADDAVVNAGDQIGFTITVTNTGDGTAFGVTISDVLPTNAGLSWSIESQTGGWSIDAGGTLSFGPADLASGASTSVHIVSDTTADTCGDVPNLAEVTFNGGSGEDSSSVTVQCPDIEVTKTASNSPITAGEDTVFAITVENIGEGVANDVVLTDPLPAGIEWVDDSALCDIAAGTLTCDLGDMDPGETFTVHVSGATNNASAADNDCGDLPNIASATASNEASGDTDNNSDDATIVVECPDVVVVKDAVTTPIQVGEDAVFSITVSNAGEGTAVDVLLVDDLPAGYDWTDDSDACDIAAGTLTCDLGDMEPGDTFTVTLTAPTVDEGASSADCGTINNVATADAVNESEDDLANNSDDAAIVVECPSALTIEKSFTGNTGGTDPILNVPLAKIGDTLHYTLTYTGVGPITNGIITDVLPVGLDYVAGSASSDANFAFVSFDPATRTLTWKTAADVTLDSPSGSLTYDVVVLEAAAEEVQPLVNVATIDSDETEPDSDSRSVAVLPAPEELTPPPTSTLSPETGTSSPGFGLMLVLLGLAGLALGVGFITPVPERVRRRDRLG
ncbi:MAG TPA: hypothetical protein VGQ64_07150 [Candidatus Limnocylindrales bacterium]|nr:hypothetical protein [Candidatus Limnocylindrales bacterium]